MTAIGCLGVGSIGGGSPTLVAPLIAWGTREVDETQIDDGAAPFLPIPAGQLDAVRSSVARLWKQYEGRPNWTDLAEIIGEAWRDADAQIGSIKSQIPVSSADGVQLDLIGELVNLPRYGLDDDDYRKAIKVEVQTLISSGTAPQIIDAVATIAPNNAITYTEIYPAALIVDVDAITVEQLDLLLTLLCDMPQGGVAALLAASDRSTARGFGYTSGVAYGGSWSYTAGTTPGIAAPWGYAIAFNKGC